MPGRGLLASGTPPDNFDRTTLGLEAIRQILQRRKGTQSALGNIGDRPALGTDHVMMCVAVELHPQGAMVHAEFLENAFLYKKVDVLIDSRE